LPSRSFQGHRNFHSIIQALQTDDDTAQIISTVLALLVATEKEMGAVPTILGTTLIMQSTVPSTKANVFSKCYENAFTTLREMLLTDRNTK